MPVRTVAWVAILTASLLTTVARATAGSPIHALEIEGVIGPPAARYLERELRLARAAGAGLVVLRLDTPGGLMDATQDIVRLLLEAPVPVAVYVAPSGARAASAGMFVTLAAHVAAMAPGTHIGAAHPVALRGGGTDQVMAEKVVNDAAAMARAVASTRGRNARWAERAVRESVSITDAEALDKKVVDLVARDRDALLSALDGRKIDTPAGPRVLETSDARIVERPMRFADRILQVISDPNVAYILFMIGLIGLAAELYNPGMIFPGLTGAIALVLALAAFGTLPVNWAGALLVALGIVLVALEAYTEGVGVLGGAGLVAFVLGSLFLYEPRGPGSPTMPDLQVSPWLVGGMAATMAAFFLVVLRSVVRARRAGPHSGAEALVGQTAVATSDLAPKGTVRLSGEAWSAEAQDGSVRAGERVRVVGVSGVTLRVARAT